MYQHDQTQVSTAIDDKNNNNNNIPEMNDTSIIDLLTGMFESAQKQHDELHKSFLNANGTNEIHPSDKESSIVNNALDMLLDPSIDSTRNDKLRADASFLPAKLLTRIDEEKDLVVVDVEDDDNGGEEINAVLNATSGDTIDSAISDTGSMTNEILRQISKQEISNEKLKTIEEEHLRKHSKSGSINHNVLHSHHDEFERKLNDNDDDNDNNDKPEVSATGMVKFLQFNGMES